jgi:hypothetical protein
MSLAIAAAALIALVLVYEASVRLPGSEALWRFVAIVGTVSIVFAADRVEAAYGPELGNTWVWSWLVAVLAWVIVRAMITPKPNPDGASSGDSTDVTELAHLEADLDETQKPTAGSWAALAGLGIVLAAVVAVGVQTAPLVNAKDAAREAARASQEATRLSARDVANDVEEEREEAEAR